ncbi:MAG: efflux transporter outer membrane subunit [Dokdonella sp.]|uniref:efflux transporter outer membrane subunit n=1 Tax=Dokdonella sp. TaxID=2291710 RepID=UPI003267F740
MRGRTGVALAAVSLAGCAAPSLPTLPDTTPPRWENVGREAAPAPDLRSWWTAFNDPALDHLVDEALAQNLTLREAALRLDAARALAGAQGSAFRPQLGVHTFSEPAPDSSASYFQAGFDAKWELGFFGRAKSHERVASADLGIAASDEQAARVSVVAEVVRRCVELRGSRQMLVQLQEMAVASQRKSELVATRVRLRLASPQALMQARVEQANAETALGEPRLAIERARRQLGVLLARAAPLADSETGTSPLQIADTGIATLPADLLRTRPEIRHAESDVLKAAGQLGLARADLLPRIGLGGSLTYASKVIGHTRLSDADGIVTFGPAIDIPLFDWGARRAVVTARDAELSASLLAYRQAVLEAVAEVETALATLENLRERLDALGRATTGLREAAAAAATLHRLGLADDLDRATANVEVWQARMETSRVRQERSLAFIALYKALGGAPLPDDAIASPPRESPL